MRAILFASCLFTFAAPLVHAEAPPLLQEIANKWADERTRWAFTQLVKETDSKGVVHERLERFDPSQGYDKRWHLLKLDGKTPSLDEIEDWNRRKNGGRKKIRKSWLEYVDLEHARVRENTATAISYEVPLKRAAGGLFPGDKVAVVLTIDKKTRSIEHAKASIDEPFNVALGLAQVVDLDLNLELPPEKRTGENAAERDATTDRAKGQATAVVNRFGKRVEYTWSDFKRAELATQPRS